MFLFFDIVLSKGLLSSLFDSIKFENYENFVDEARYDAEIKTNDSALIDLMKTEFVVFGTETCGYTKKALTLLKDKGMSYVFVDKDKNMTNTYEDLKKDLRHETLPLIIRNRRFFGGYGKLKEYFENPYEFYKKYYEKYYGKNYGNTYSTSSEISSFPYQ
ncbi:Glutaredoxin [Trachipleistophora hominis]|uniref:Glutaredoxin n=1 Tax=Trachipleistophora hominis TaxID=72359 RepID=L7JXC2_TRAHO|nr:Glutaredoxin [Trachipleistophora hominis]